MEIEQALSVLTQAINVAVGGGVFKTSDDVAVVQVAKETLIKFVEANNSKPEAEEAAPLKKAK